MTTEFAKLEKFVLKIIETILEMCQTMYVPGMPGPPGIPSSEKKSNK